MEVELILNIIYMVCFFVIGTLFGSFFTLATYRIPRKQDIMVKRSYCTNCKHNLGFFDLIPVLSYVFLGGKCRYCKGKISIRYPLFEVANGIFFLLTYCLFGLHWILFVTLGIYIALFLIIGCSIMKKRMLAENDNVSKKKGVFNVELLVAVFAFIIYYIATIYTTRNYEDTLRLTKLRSDAMNVAINVIEENKSKAYENVNNVHNEKVKVDNYTYVYNLGVEEYNDISGESNPIDIKKISVDVEYKYDEETYSVYFETLIYEE